MHGKDVQVLGASQDDQGRDMKKTAKSHNGTAEETEERGEQGEVSVHPLEHFIEEQRNSGIAGGRDKISCKKHPMEWIMRQEFRRRRSNVIRTYEPPLNKG